jgi:transcriptional regulator with XRE-family HTH domain
MYIFQRLRDLREDRDLKQADIARILQTTQQTYSLWERGEREIPLHHVITLAKFYKVSMDYICGLSNRKKL